MSEDTDISRTRRCEACGAKLPRPSGHGQPLNFCPQCGTRLMMETEIEGQSTTSEAEWMAQGGEEAVTLKPAEAEEKTSGFHIGRYKILDKIGKGGMGEVFLGFDPICGRRVALKRIRADLRNSKKLAYRFGREARITGQLAHPAVVPIYAIHQEDKQLYYTMPYIEGQTLKQILRETRRQQDAGQDLHQVGGSIPELIRIFLSLCHAIAYAHSRGVLHRDLKPENVIVGTYGQVIILDWGLAKLLTDREVDEPLSGSSSDETMAEEGSNELTVPGKIVGTVSYMAPERAKGDPASLQTDIYAMGVILYQCLTLRQPFRRGSLSEFKKDPYGDVVPEPSQVAPYREVPHSLARIVDKCLEPDVTKRCECMNDLIRDLENYITGRSEWFPIADLDPSNEKDWEFQEHVLLTEHVAITRLREQADWVMLMVSKASFPENIKVTARVKIRQGGQGIGFLLSIPEWAKRTHLSEGYCLWLGSGEQPTSSQLYRSNVEVLNLPECYLEQDQWHDISIEKVDNKITFFLNGQLQASYTSHLPLIGTHTGLVARDGAFEVEDFQVYGGSLHLMVSRLAVPDAFLDARLYDRALEEYRRIGTSFPGRSEGREALFRAGVTLLERARSTPDLEEADKLYDSALDEFGKLHHTPGAPFEYLGKSLVYKALRDFHEEINCLELGVRRYRKHPLAKILEEQILYRLHDSSRLNRHATYRFALLAIQLSPTVVNSPNSRRLFLDLKKHWEPLPMMEDRPEWEPKLRDMEEEGKWNFGITLAFWLRKPFSIREIIEDLLALDQPDAVTLSNALYAWLFMQSHRFAAKVVDRLRESHDQDSPLHSMLVPIELLLQAESTPLTTVLDQLLELAKGEDPEHTIRAIWYCCQQALAEGHTSIVHQACNAIATLELDGVQRRQVDAYAIWAYLLDQRWEEANKILDSYSEAEKLEEDSPLFFLNGCYLAAAVEPAAAEAHFSGVVDSVQPRSWALLATFLKELIGTESEWFRQSFWWERRQLYRQLALYYHCVGDYAQRDHYRLLEKQETEGNA